MRVNQLDALQLDSELSLLLSYQLRRVFHLFHPSFLTSYKPELDALLALLLFSFTTALDQPTPGSKLQNLTLSSRPSPSASLGSLLSSPTTSLASPLSLLSTSDRFVPRSLSAWQKRAYLLLTVVLPYAHARLSAYLSLHSFHSSPSDARRRLYALTSSLASLTSLLSFANFVAFLRDGRYPTLALRLLGVRLLYLRSRVARQLSFDYMHQSMAMQVIGDCSSVLLGLVDWRAVGGTVRGAARWLWGEDGSKADAEDADERGERDGCPVCGRGVRVMSTLALPCLHAYCYYCISSHLRGEAVWRCLLCQQVVTGVTPWSAEREQQRTQRSRRRLTVRSPADAQSALIP